MKLNQLQNEFIAAIFNIDRSSALEHIKSDNRLDASQRLGIYRGSVHGILTQSLGETFPVCKDLLGEEFFDKMCDYFIDQYPPSSPFFSDYGNNLPIFLDNFDPVKAIPYISDVADFEWSRNILWHKKSAEPFDFSSLANLDENQQSKIVFHLNRTLHLYQSKYRIDHIWFAHQEDSEIDLEAIDINESIKLLVWKGENTIKVANIENSSDSDEKLMISDKFTNHEYWEFLTAVSNENTITELANTFNEKFPELLNQSIQDGWIESFTSD